MVYYRYSFPAADTTGVMYEYPRGKCLGPDRLFWLQRAGLASQHERGAAGLQEDGVYRRSPNVRPDLRPRRLVLRVHLGRRALAAGSYRRSDDHRKRRADPRVRVERVSRTWQLCSAGLLDVHGEDTVRIIPWLNPHPDGEFPVFTIELTQGLLDDKF